MGLLESMRVLTWCQFLACTLFLLLFSWHLPQGNYLIALLYLNGAFITVLLLSNEQAQSQQHRTILLSAAFTVYTFLSLLLLLTTKLQTSHLLLSLHLAYPLLAFSLLPFRVALLFILIFSVLANFLLMLQLEGIFRAAYVIAFWLVILLTSLQSFAQHSQQAKLQNQLNRDPQTQLLNKQQLRLDLHKEQERSQREATHLGIIYLTSEKEFNRHTAKEIAALFLIYEGLYSITTHQLAALLPLASSKELKVREKALAQALPHLKLTSQLSTPKNLATDQLLTHLSQAGLTPSKTPL